MRAKTDADFPSSYIASFIYDNFPQYNKPASTSVFIVILKPLPALRSIRLFFNPVQKLTSPTLDTESVGTKKVGHSH